MIVMCPLCQESEWFDDEDEDESYDDEEVIVEICGLCLLDEGMYFVIDEVDVCGFLQDVYFLCGDLFLQEVEIS